MSPEFVRAGPTSPEYPPAGSMSPELVYAPARAGSMSPDFAQQQGRGHTPMTEDELVCNPAPAPSTAADSEPRTFHCERVRKMPLSGLDPSPLLGFGSLFVLLLHVAALPLSFLSCSCPTHPIVVTLFTYLHLFPYLRLLILLSPFAVPCPSPSLTCTPASPHLCDSGRAADGDDDLGLESVSDVEEAARDDDDISSASHAPSTASHPTSTASHVAASTFSHTHQHSNSNSTASSGVDTEDDHVAPITPLPGARFEISAALTRDMEIEDDWVDPVAPTSTRAHANQKKSKGKRKAVLVPSVHYPFPVSVEDVPQMR
ncbi:hypothetical protein B0H10DRAFT_2227635 [Mycena sp. CBHHK59/15]|nr:hypothetical protein B0H10DRAFT_2227635 [Mycena sp. CBHHK59/15]